MKRTLALTIALLLVCTTLRAQLSDTSKWDFHLSTGTSVAAGFGHTQALGWVAPSFSFKPTSRLTVRTGLVAAASLLPDNFSLKGYSEQSLAPWRKDTRVQTFWAEGEYRFTDRLTLWGAVAHAKGFVKPLWLDQSIPMQATAFSGGFRYAVTDNSLFEMHFHIVHDPYGTAGIGLLGHTPYGAFAPHADLFYSPTMW